MKLTALTGLLALSTGGVDAKMTKRKLEFIRTMRESEKINGPIRGGAKPNLAAFLRKSQEVSSLKGGQGPAVSKEELERKLDNYAKFEQFIAESKSAAATNANSNARSLEEQGNDYEGDPEYEGGQYNNNYNNNYNNYNSNYNNYNANNQNVKDNSWYSKFLKWFQNQGNNTDLEDEYANTVTEMYADNDGNRTYDDVMGLADLSIKYAGCSSTTSFTSEVEDEDSYSSHFVPDTLVQYRLCPADSCQDNSWAGCRSEYGQYMMNLEDFLDTQSDLMDMEFEMLCGYCETCYSFDDSAYCEEGSCCTHSHDCGDYDDYCSGEADDQEEPPSYDELFNCMEVDLSEYNRRDLRNRKLEQDYQSQYDDQSQSASAYVGVHCNGVHIELGLFSDSTCTSLIGSEEDIDIANITGYEYSTAELEEFYVPEGCLTCGGEDYNVSNSSYLPEDYQKYKLHLKTNQ